MMNEYTKRHRQQLLKEIIAKKDIGDQVHLQEALQAKGIEATQATISRDLQELGVVKARSKSGGFRYEIPEQVPDSAIWNKLGVLFDNFVGQVLRTGKLLLVKTTPGNANGVASFIDRLGRKDILGTIAGDDTVLVITPSAKAGRTVESDFRSLRDGGPAGGGKGGK